MLKRMLLAVGVVVGVSMFGCSSGGPPPQPPPPPVQQAPAELSKLLVHVHRLVTPPKTPEDEWDYHHMPGYTKGLRAAFQVQLTRAGYTVVLDRRAPRDIVATVQADWPYDHAGVATLKVTAGGRVIDQMSVEIPIIGKPPYTTYLDEHAAVGLVHALSSSEAVRAFAREGTVDRPLQIAQPPAESTGGPIQATEPDASPAPATAETAAPAAPATSAKPREPGLRDRW